MTQSLDPDLVMRLVGSGDPVDVGGSQVPTMEVKIVGHHGATDLQAMMESVAVTSEGAKGLMGPHHYALLVTQSDDARRPVRCRVFTASLDSASVPTVRVGTYQTRLGPDDAAWDEVPEHVHRRPTRSEDLSREELVNWHGRTAYQDTRFTIYWRYRDFAEMETAFRAFMSRVPKGAALLESTPDVRLPFWASLMDAASREAAHDGQADSRLVVACLTPDTCRGLHGFIGGDEFEEDEML